MSEELALLLNVADAVAARINAPGEGHSWCVDDPYDDGDNWGVSAVRTYDTEFHRKDLLPLQVRVIPNAITHASGTRGKRAYECAVDVVVAKRIASPAEADLLMKFVEEIGDLLAFGTVAWDRGSAAWAGESQDPAFDRAEMQGNVFLAALTLVYKTQR